MKSRPTIKDRLPKPSGSSSPVWWLVFVRELSDLWIGGKALILTLIYTILLGIVTYVMASNSDLNILPAKELVYEVVKGVIAAGIFISLILGADTISGERERATLEGLLLTPASRRQIIFGKYLAAVSAWPVLMAIAIPYMLVLSQGDKVFGPAVLLGAVFGSLLASAFCGLGMLVSFWSNTNRNSMLVSLGVMLLFFLPSQLPGPAQTGAPGRFLQWANPMQAPNYFMAKFLVNNRTFDELKYWLIIPALFALFIFILLFLYAGPALRLEAGKASRLFSFWRRLLGVTVIVGLLILASSPTMAVDKPQPQEEKLTTSQPLKISIDLDHKTVKAGDPVLFNTVVTNVEDEQSPPLIVAMNIINLNAQGDVVDPEDWSPQRTQYIEQLGSGQSATQSWTVNAIFAGDYMVYMVLIPAPEGQEATSQPVASSGIHLTVTPFTRLNPKGILPYAIGGPLIVLVGIILVYRIRRRQIDTGAK